MSAPTFALLPRAAAGTFQRQAEIMRLKAKFGQAGMRQLRAQQQRAKEKAERKAEDEAAAAAAAEDGGDPNLVPLGSRSTVRSRVASPPHSCRCRHFSLRCSWCSYCLPALFTLVHSQRPPPKDIPDIEWWDAPIVPPGTTFVTLQTGNPPLLHDKARAAAEAPVAVAADASEGRRRRLRDR